MAEVIHDSQEFWRSPTVLEPLTETGFPSAGHDRAEACADCCTEFMIGASFCHTCGIRRPVPTEPGTDAAVIAGLWARGVAFMRGVFDSAAAYWREITLPAWLHYLHFHEIQRLIGLPTASLIAFIVGLGCLVGAVGVSLFYRASNLAEFQAIQMWRVEWLLAATASFVAGILLKPSDIDRD